MKHPRILTITLAALTTAPSISLSFPAFAAEEYETENEMDAIANGKETEALDLSGELTLSKISAKKQLKMSEQSRLYTPYMHFDGEMRAAGNVSDGSGDDAYTSGLALALSGSVDYMTKPVFVSHLTFSWSYIVEDSERRTDYQAYLMDDGNTYSLYTGERLPDEAVPEDETEEETEEKETEETENPVQIDSAGNKIYKDKDGYTWKRTELPKETGDYLKTVIQCGRFAKYLQNNSKNGEKNGVKVIDKTLSSLDFEQMINDNAALINLAGSIFGNDDSANLAESAKKYLPLLDGVKLNTEYVMDKKKNLPKAITIDSNGSNYMQAERYLNALLNDEEVEQTVAETEGETEDEGGLAFQPLGITASGYYMYDTNYVVVPDELQALKENEEETEGETEKATEKATEKTTERATEKTTEKTTEKS